MKAKQFNSDDSKISSLFFYMGGRMDKQTIIISMPKNSTKQDIIDMRNKYKDKYKVNIILSGSNNVEETIRNFLKARLEV